MANKYDVVIAGAGMAGCLAGRDLARKGWKVALLDRRPRAHIGHNWWDSIVLEAFDEVGLPMPEPPERMLPTNELTAYSPLETTTMIVPLNPAKANINRRLLADRMLKYAIEAGVDFFDETAVLGPLSENSVVTGLVARDKNNPEIKFEAKLTMDATGLPAPLRKNTSNPAFPRYINRWETFVTYREIRDNTDGSDKSTMIFGKDNGVVWVKRSQPGLVDIFAGVINIEGRPKPREILKEILAKEKGVGNKIVMGGYGAPLPVRRCLDSFVAPGLVLCGDSACQCNPIDGSGMASTMRAARFAAISMDAALRNGRTDVEALWQYNAAYKSTQGAKFAALNLIQRFMVSQPKPRFELLFKRSIIDPKAFWGTGSSGSKESKLDKIKKLLKLVDKPSLISSLITMTNSMKDIEEHYKNFPEKFSQSEFDLWRDGTESILNRFPEVRKY